MLRSISPRPFILLASLLLASILFSSQSAGAQAAAGPNVLLILTDDMRLDGLAVMDRLNQLAQRGTTFHNFFVTTPVCCPSRSTLLTGLYAHNHGVRGNYAPIGGFEAFDDRATLATWLDAGGVRTGLIGRYLNGYGSTYVPPGWDFFFGMWGTEGNLGNYYKYDVTENGIQREFHNRPDDYSTRVIQNQAARFLNISQDRPFFLLVTPRAPHGPALPDPLDRGAFDDYQPVLPPSYNEADVRDKPRLVQETPPLTAPQKDKIEELRRDQLSSLLGVDRMIGVLVDRLQADGRLDNTWIIFSPDNGLMLGEHRWRARKSCAYEECVHLPLIVIPPVGTPVPATDDHLVANIDLAPTVAAMLGLAPGAPVDGQSFLPLLAGPATGWRDELLLEVWGTDPGESFKAIRTAGWKYVRYDWTDVRPEDGDEELYNEVADPYELESQHANPSLAEVRANLDRRLTALVANTTR